MFGSLIKKVVGTKNDSGTGRIARWWNHISDLEKDDTHLE